jgi:hypothetical protein
MEKPDYQFLYSDLEKELRKDLENVDFYMEQLPKKLFGIQPYIDEMMNKYGVAHPKDAVITDFLRERHKAYLMESRSSYWLESVFRSSEK